MKTATDGTLILGCTKQAYTKKDALSFINEAKTNKGHARRRKNVKTLRAYPCKVCKHWHITSKEKYEI